MICAGNNLGLLYKFDLDDQKKAYKYIHTAACNEYPFAQNNFGLLRQLYFDDVMNAEYFYEKSSKNHFALADYNIGYLKEKNGDISGAIECYKKASENEDCPLIFHNVQIFDKRLSISKTFIMCLTNLKLTEYYFLPNSFNESKKYFIKIFGKLNVESNSSYKFNFIFNPDDNENQFSYLKYFILCFPLFDISKEQNSFKMDKQENLSNLTKQENTLNMKIDENSLNLNKQEDNTFNDPGKLYDFIIQNERLKSYFIDEIKNIIFSMNEILYKPPYHILFGRINIRNQSKSLKKEASPFIKDINDNFYDGFGIKS